jgi:hypothetical protein
MNPPTKTKDAQRGDRPRRARRCRDDAGVRCRHLTGDPAGRCGRGRSPDAICDVAPGAIVRLRIIRASRRRWPDRGRHETRTVLQKSHMAKSLGATGSNWRRIISKAPIGMCYMHVGSAVVSLILSSRVSDLDGTPNRANLMDRERCLRY